MDSSTREFELIAVAMEIVDYWYSLPTNEIVRRDVAEARLIVKLAEVIGPTKEPL